MIIAALLKLQSFFFAKNWDWLYRKVRRLSRHYRTFQADDISQTSLGASSSNYFRVGIFFSKTSDLQVVSREILLELSNGMINSNYHASLTLIQAQEKSNDSPLPNASESSVFTLPGQTNRTEREVWLRQQINANSIDIWIIIDGYSEFLEDDLFVFLKHSNQVALLTDIPFKETTREGHVKIQKSVYSLPDILLIRQKEEYERWKQAGFDNCIQSSENVLDQIIEQYRNLSLNTIGNT